MSLPFASGLGMLEEAVSIDPDAAQHPEPSVTFSSTQAFGYDTEFDPNSGYLGTPAHPQATESQNILQCLDRRAVDLCMYLGRPLLDNERKQHFDGLM
jgi:hypothetical protein